MAEQTYLEKIGQAEHEDSLNKKKELLQAYNQDVLGSYDNAQKRAYDNALPDDFAGPLSPSASYTTRSGKTFSTNIGKRADYQWIQKIRGIAATEFQSQKRKEIDELQVKYNLNKPTEGPIGSFVDMPVRFTDALGRDVGITLGETVNQFASGVSFVVGQSGVIAPIVATADRYVTAAIDDVTRIVTQSPWLEKKIKGIKDKSTAPLDLKKVNSFLDGINTTFASHFRIIMGDLAEVLNEWYHDPRTLCCLIKTLAALAMATGKTIKGDNSTKSFGSTYNQVVKKYFTGNAKFSELTETREFFDKMIAILKIIREFLKQSMNFNFALNLDLGLSMSKASVGALMALLTALQQMLEDKIYTKMMDFVKKQVREEIRQCIPFEKLLRMLADWMTGPDGIFKFIEQFIDAYMIGFATNTQYGFDQSAKVKMMDIAALDKLISLLEKMRDAMLNLELCIEADFSKTPELSDDGLNNEVKIPMNPTNYDDLVEQIRDNQYPSLKTGNRIVYPTDREITAFIVNRLGESNSFAQQVLDSARATSDLNVGRASGSPDNAGGSGDPTVDLRMAIGDCARTLNSKKIEDLAKLVADWEII